MKPTKYPLLLYSPAFGQEISNVENYSPPRTSLDEMVAA